MNDLGAPVPPAPTPEAATGFFANLIDLFFAPGEAFANMLRKPSPWVPLFLNVALSVAFTGIWLQKVDKVEFMKAQVEQSPRWDRVPVEQRAAILERQAAAVPAFSWGFALVFGPLFILIVSAVLLFVFRFFYASDVTFKQSLTIVSSAMVAVGLIAIPLTLGVLAMKGDWNLNPGEALQANLSLFLDKQTAAKPLWALASSLDLFMLWRVALLTAGFAAASKRQWLDALPGVAVPWVLTVAISVAFSFFR
jgi:hypothetical protein